MNLMSSTFHSSPGGDGVAEAHEEEEPDPVEEERRQERREEDEVVAQQGRVAGGGVACRRHCLEFSKGQDNDIHGLKSKHI